jgi:outer membrane biogenesis lipoprotein LolB
MMLRRTLVAALAAAVLLACSDDDETGPSSDLSGNYTLQSFQQGENAGP